MDYEKAIELAKEVILHKGHHPRQYTYEEVESLAENMAKLIGENKEWLIEHGKQAQALLALAEENEKLKKDVETWREKIMEVSARAIEQLNEPPKPNEDIDRIIRIDELEAALSSAREVIKLCSEYGLTRHEIKERFKYCWDYPESSGKLIPSEQYGLLLLLNDNGEMIFKFSGIGEAIEKARQWLSENGEKV